jgi:predicted DNA-binding transcriptional regulator YafY
MQDKRNMSPSGQTGRALSIPRRSADPARAQRKRPGKQRFLGPVTLSEDEAEAIIICLAIASEEEAALAAAAHAIVGKLVDASNDAMRARLARAAEGFVKPRPAEWDEMVATIEGAIADERELRISYADQTGEDTVRTIRPLAFAESRKGESVAAWCKLREDFRHFRLDRIVGIAVLESNFKGQRERLLQQYMATV